MPRPGVGNPGNKGGCRGSAYKERTNAEIVKSIFLRNYHDPVTGEALDLEKVKERIRKGVQGGWDICAFKIWTGNDRILSEMLRKMVPDLVDVTSGGQSVSLPPDELARLTGLFGRREDA